MKDEAAIDDTFYISLATDNLPHTVPRLLRHAMASLRSAVGDTDVYITELNLEAPFTLDDSCSVRVAYIEVDGEMQETTSDAQRYRDDHKVSEPTQLAVYTPGIKESAKLRLLTYRLPQDDDQANSIQLVEKLATYLEEKDIQNICDLVYHDCLDEDALHHPFINVYYLED